MKTLKCALKNIFVRPTRSGLGIYHEWDRQRARAMSPSELSEIDAIFSRSV